MDCPECREDHEQDGEEPPCSTCPNPRRLLKANEVPWKLWLLLSQFDRDIELGMGGAMRKKIKSADALALCSAYKATMEDFEKILSLELALFPVLEEKWSRKSKIGG